MNEVENNLEDAGELEWHFRMSSPDVSGLKQAASKFEDEFVVHLQENVEVLDGDTNQTEQGDPMLVLICKGDLSGDEVAALEGRFKMFGEQNGLKYDGCDSFESIDEDEIYGWLTADAAYWRLRHLTDCGLEEDAELPWTFFVRTPSLDVNSKVCNGLESIGIGDLDEFVEPDDEGLYSVCAFTLGRNNEAELRTMVEKVSGVIEPVGVVLEGIQFYTREQFEMVFLEGDEEE